MALWPCPVQTLPKMKIRLRFVRVGVTPTQLICLDFEASYCHYLSFKLQGTSTDSTGRVVKYHFTKICREILAQDCKSA